MPSVSLTVTIALAIVGLIAALLWRRSGNAAAILMVVGVIAAAIAVTVIEVNQYRSDQAAARTIAVEVGQAQAQAPLPPPSANTSPVMQGARGAAAPATVRPPRS